jgi:uncharacterized protein GlcG (DUF336 family)
MMARGSAVADIGLTGAENVVRNARRKARKIDTLMNIVVVDAGGNLKAFVRMDGACLGSIDIAIKKARTARFFVGAVTTRPPAAFSSLTASA